MTSGYLQLNLVSDQANTALVQDSNLVAPWGTGMNPGAGAIWVADKATGVATLYGGDVNGSAFADNPLVVGIPGGSPTGVTFNGTTNFSITSGGAIGPATFLFAGESGQVSGWNSQVPPGSSQAIIGATAGGAVFKGLALADDSGTNLIYVTDFHAGTVDVFNSNFQPVSLGSGAFSDASIPSGFAPFNIENLNDQLYVTYAKQDAKKQDDVPGVGNGFVDVFNPDGTLAKRLISGQPGNPNSPLNSPYGIALAPANFGDLSGDLLVGNSGDGMIHAFDPTTGAPLGTLMAPLSPLSIQGLKDLRFGNGLTAGDANKLFFTADPSNGAHGLFGTLQSAQGTNLAAEGLVFGATANIAFNGPVATFVDRMSSIPANQFTATIAWGDGGTTSGTVVALADGGFNVTGAHVYTHAGTFFAKITLTDPLHVTTVASSQAVVTVPPLLMTGTTLGLTEGAAFAGTVATLTDTDGNHNTAAYTASVVWGDGVTTTPTLVPNGTGFDIRDSHTYTEEGNDTIVVEISDADGNSNSITSVANVADASLTASGATLSTSEGTTSTFTVATFNDADPNGKAGDYTAEIQWGDGSSSAATVTASGGGFAVNAPHDYADEGTYSATVSIVDAGGSTASASTTVVVSDADVLVGSPSAVTPTEGQAVTNTLATFTDADAGNTAADLIATIDWGDGTTQSGTITGGSGTFSVNGNHAYADEGTFQVSVTLADDVPGTASATVAFTVAVAEADSLSATLSAIAPTEGAAFSGTVATIGDKFTGNSASDLSATIDWGDGTTDVGTITGSSGSFAVSGSHTYLEEATVPFSVTIADDAPSTASATANTNLVVADAPLSAAAVTISSTEHATFSGAVATFTDADPNGTLADYSATIDWGDGSGTTTGSITSNGMGGYFVSGSHSYAEGGTYHVGVLVNDSGGAGAGAISTANVADFALHATAGPAIQGTEGDVFSGTVATFTDDDPDGGSAGEYNVTIDWGDGTTSSGTVTGGSGAFTVTGNHTFADESTAVNAVIDDAGGSTASASVNATVADADSLSGVGSSVTVSEGQTVTATLATFTDTYAGNTAGDFSATIVWGDGATSAGTVSGSGGNFTVSGSHAYATTGTFDTSVVLADDAPGTAVATATFTAQVSSSTIVLSAMAIQGPEHTLLNVPVATFTNAGTPDPVANYSATIDWGDGTLTVGMITLNAGVYTVSGTHTYADEGHYALSVTAVETNGQSATGQSTASVVEEVLSIGGPGTANQRWVNEQYNDLLGRSADPGGLAYWSGQVDAGASRASVVTALTLSQEYRQDEVQAVFERYLHRAADTGAVTSFTPFLQNHTEEQLSTIVAGSPEFFRVQGGGTDDGFLDALFHDALGRSVDSGARQYFDQLLASGDTTGQVAALVISSSEYLDDVVKGIYLQFLDRPADAGGLAFWASQLQAGVRDEQIIDAIAASDEDFGKTA
jgi:uncharacterized protein (TIGR03118 family)